MTSLSYMVRKDWGQHGTAMESQSGVIREWLGEGPYLFAVVDTQQVNAEDRPADLEFVEYVAPEVSPRRIFDISELARSEREGQVMNHAVVIVHPFDERELEAIRGAVVAGTVERLFVMLSSPRDRIRAWLDGVGAVNLHTGTALPAADPLMVAAAQMIVSHEYNGLASGRGKDAIVQLVRAFAAEGYPVDVDVWMRAYFAAGGSFRHSESVARLISEMASGTKHRVRQRYQGNIMAIIRDLVDDTDESADTAEFPM